MAQHYFSESPESDGTPREIEVRLAGEARTVRTAAGVFSPDGLDRGTAVLLRELPDPSLLESTGPDGPILDLGCGWGPIAISAAIEHPAREVWAVDINARSRDLTRANATTLDLSRLRVAAPDEVPVELSFAEIRSNPPIRIGKAALHDLLRQWLPRLAPGGSAYLVVAKHLGADSLQRWIAAEFADLEVGRFARDKGFHVIHAVRRGQGSSITPR